MFRASVKLQLIVCAAATDGWEQLELPYKFYSILSNANKYTNSRYIFVPFPSVKLCVNLLRETFGLLALSNLFLCSYIAKRKSKVQSYKAY